MKVKELNKLLDLFDSEAISPKQLKLLFRVYDLKLGDWVRLSDVKRNKSEGYDAIKSRLTQLTNKGLLDTRKINDCTFEYRISNKARQLIGKFLDAV